MEMSRPSGVYFENASKKRIARHPATHHPLREEVFRIGLEPRALRPDDDDP